MTIKKSERSEVDLSRNIAGWVFVSPVLIILGIFLVVPVLMALWVSFSNWTGRGSPFSSDISWIGFSNYRAVLTDEELANRDFGISIRNNAYYVLFVVPLQTVFSLMLAMFVNQRILRARGFFRTAFYFPSVTSSVAITVLWLFLFSFTGPVNKVLSWFGATGPNWFQDPRGVLHILFESVGLRTPPKPLISSSFLGLPAWDWLAGPSVAMLAFILMAVFTTSGTFMLLFIAALQAIGNETDEAGMMDGANTWQRFRFITVPMLKPTVFTVVTLGLIGCWQVFDQIYTGTQGGPAKTTLTPAYLSFNSAFNNQKWGQGAAIAFILFLIIVFFTLLQRIWLGDRDEVKERRQRRHQQRAKRKTMKTLTRNPGDNIRAVEK
ncbi:MAG: sugar ABC transporter permease [Actinomycetaceae bacterium]|nr:sugar ABC transporter permease [Actinomycetaceae bacterium]